jgi:phosphopantothenoylcysteine decarboxylase/phosphopantothenate--cysteine ligase
VDLGLWADLFLIAPASANTISKMASGLCDNLLLATYLSSRCPVYIAPAMDVDMYQHTATVNNLNQLRSFGNTIIDADHGELASGLVGEGRMAEPESLVNTLINHFKKKTINAELKVLITAGPTQESLDPVRFISNHSTGKMGYAIAMELAERGAKVNLVSGPVNLKISHPNIEKTSVSSAQEMLSSCKSLYPDCDIAIFTAAVSDYRPAKIASQKIKKSGKPATLELINNPDIAYELGLLKQSSQINVGFALETENEIENASLKIKKKNFDYIILNSLKDKGAGFSYSTNKITIIDQEGNQTKYGLKSKMDVAQDIINYILDKIDSN